MSKQNAIEIVSNAVDLISNYDDEYEILNFITDNVPGLKIGFKFRECISDYLFKSKLEKFKRYANEFTTSTSFESFKNKIEEDEEYRKKISQYILLKIDKFDTDFKISVFSKVCVDFFKGTISEEELESISETLDFLKLNDIQVLKEIYKDYGLGRFIAEDNVYIPNFKTEYICSVVRKSEMLGLVISLGGEKVYKPKTLSKIKNDGFTDPIYNRYCITKQGEMLIKYI